MEDIRSVKIKVTVQFTYTFVYCHIKTIENVLLLECPHVCKSLFQILWGAIGVANHIVGVVLVTLATPLKP